MESSVWSLITEDSDKATSFTFTIPKVYPSSSPLLCISSQDISQTVGCASNESSPPLQGTMFVSNGADSQKLKRKDKAPLTVTEVRMSDRIISNKSGFKAKTCSDRPCLCCDTEPPTLSSKVIKNLGKDFCKIPAKKISEGTLKKKVVAKKISEDTLKKKVVAKKTANSGDKAGTTPTSTVNDADAENPKKKNKQG
jgi:hypothetical protein